MNNLLSANKINKKVALGKQNELHILKDVDVTIQRGEFVAIMGPSGSGKSTLLYNISGIDRATSGTVQFLDQRIDRMSEEELSALRLHRMGFVFQDINLLKNLSLLDNILFPALMKNRAAKQELRGKANALMTRMGIEGLVDNLINQGSGGQLQRVAICRALINEPDILFGDEPTGALDSAAKAEIMDIIGDIHQEGTSVVLVTHYPKVAARSQRILFMQDGRISDEMVLGTYSREPGSLRAREETLSAWLIGKGH